MPIILKVDPNTGTIYTDNGTTTTPTTGTCLVMSGSPIGAIPGVQGNLALDSTSGQVYLCTVTGSTAATATWIAAFSQNNQPNNFADTQTMAALDVTGNATVGGTLGVTGAATLSDTLDVTGNATVGGNLSYLPYVIAPTASQTLPNNQKVICQTGALTADITLTTGSPPVGGEAIIYGSAAAYTTTVSTGVTSGSPYIEMPDGSQVYSYAIPASSPGAGIRIVWDGTNYRGFTFGQTIVASATAPNQAVALVQLFIGNRKAVFTANGTYTVPADVTQIWVSGVGGGGGGGSGGTSTTTAGGSGGGGGGSGQSVLRTPIAVAAGNSLSISVGAAGAGGAAPAATSGTNGNAGAAGGPTTLTNTTTGTTLLTLNGGSGGGGGSSSSGGALGGAGWPNGGMGGDGSYMSYGGQGASNPFGGGGCSPRGALGTATGYSGQAAANNGAGGSGGGATYAATAVVAGEAGGPGSAGLLIIEW